MNSVLLFHEVPDSAWFDDVICWLQSRYRLLPAAFLRDVYAGREVRNGCHITVDDGHRSFKDVIFPVLQRRQVPATLFVSPRKCAERSNFWFQDLGSCDEHAVRNAAAVVLALPVAALDGFSVTSICKAMKLSDIETIVGSCGNPRHESGSVNVTADDLREFAASGLVTLGAHTLSHPILSNESDTRSREEIAGSVTQLATLIEQDVKYFAYPNGLPGVDFSAREEQYVASAGIEFAFSTDSASIGANDRPYAIPRIQISPNESVRRIRIKLEWPRTWNVLKKRRARGEFAERERLRRTMSATGQVA